MDKKKILLVILLLSSTNALLIAENDIAPTINNKNSAATSQSISPYDTSSNTSSKSHVLNQRFMCHQKADESVTCQMYECINNDCRVSTQFNNTENTTPVNQEPISDNAYPEDQKNLTQKTEETSEPIMTNINIPMHDREEIRELEYEIKHAEKMCERAESDPREKAICEAASAKVQWRKEKIRAIENSDMQR